MPRQHTTNDPTYARNRKIVLAGSPTCHWCNKAPATTADHLTEKDLGGDDSLENLVPACRPCNSSRGATYGHKKAQAKTAARQKQLAGTNARPIKRATHPNAKKKTKEEFLDDSQKPPTPQARVSPRNPKPRKDLRASSEIPLGMGRTEPRLVTPARGSSTYGPLVAAWAKRVLQVELMPWQVVALEGQLAHDEAGNLLHRQSLVSVARQNGKTVALKALLGWWLTEFAAMRGEKQTIISTAHELSLAVALFQELAPILETNYGAKAKWSYGRNELTMPDGSIWLVRAATPSAGHGRSPSLIVCDEIWDISQDVIDQGLMPSQRARKSPLLSMWSTAGTEASHAMLRWRSAGVRIIDTGEAGRLFFAEWSPPPGVELMSEEGRQYWGWANPALGHTLELETLLAEAEAPNRAAFLRASLNMWVATDQGWLKPGVWEDAHTEEAIPSGGVLSVETSMDESRYVGVRSVTIEDRVISTVAFTCDTLAGFLDHVTEAMKDSKLQLTATPSLSEHVPLELRRRMTVVGYSELLRFTSLVRSLITEGRLRHTGEIELSEHMNRAVAVKTTAGLALSSQRSAGPIELARCLVWSAAMVSKPTSKAQPAVIVGRRR